jgi:hypothetical protein
LLAFIVVLSNAKAQKSIPNKKPLRFYAYWGYNRASYANSNIKMVGDDYNIVLKNAIATDRQTPFSYNDYIRLDRITIPQTNFKVGYYLKEDWSFGIGVDHMKYVMQQNQILNVSGNITQDGIYKGYYNNTSLPMTTDFLIYEHTDGLNFIHVELEKYYNIYSHKKFKIKGTLSASLGVVMPKTKVTFLKYPRNDAFHLAGLGATVSPGICFSLGNLYYRYMLKGGFMYMPDVKLHSSNFYSKAQQNILLLEGVGCIGYNFNIRTTKKVTKIEENKTQIN